MNDNANTIDEFATGNPYKVPSDYYADMQEQVMSQVSLPAQSGYNVPDGYWDAMADSVMDSLPKQRPRAKTVSLRRYWMAAASIAVLLLATVVLPTGTPTLTDELYTDLPDEELELYLQQAADDLSLDVLAELMEDAELTLDMDTDYESIDDILDDVTLDELDGLL